MQPDFSLSMTYPDGKDKPPICDSSAILSAFNMSALASEYIKRPLKWRRQAGTRGRNWAATEPPIHLYKYRQIVADDLQSIDRTRQLLVHGRIWFADPSSLNDLHDMRFKLELDPNLQVRRDWVKRNAHLLPQMSPAQRLQEQQRLMRVSLTPELEAAFTADMDANMGVFCASQDPRNEPMWAHYAADHQGICVQLDTSQDELSLLIKKVQYSTQFPILRIPHSSNEDQEHFLFKSTEWAYEREWRVVIPRNRLSVELRPPTIAGVILGPRSSEATRNAVEALNGERVKLGRPPFKIYQAAQHKDRYGVRITEIRA